MSIPEKFYIRQTVGEMKYLNYEFIFAGVKPLSPLMYTFRLIPGSNGSFICNNSGIMCASYDSSQKDKDKNLGMVNKDKLSDEDSALWLFDENADGTVIIRNKKNPDLVWTSFQESIFPSKAGVSPLNSGDSNQMLRIEAAD